MRDMEISIVANMVIAFFFGGGMVILLYKYSKLLYSALGPVSFFTKGRPVTPPCPPKMVYV